MKQETEDLLLNYYLELKKLVDDEEKLFFKYEIIKEYTHDVHKRKVLTNKLINELINKINDDLNVLDDDISINKLFNLFMQMDKEKYPIVDSILKKYNYQEKFQIYYDNIEYRLLKNMKMSESDKDALATKIIMNDEDYNYYPIYNQIIKRMLLKEDKPLEYDNFKKMLVLYMKKMQSEYITDGECYIKDERPERYLGTTVNNKVFLFDEVIRDFYDNNDSILIFTMFHELFHIQQYGRVIVDGQPSVLNLYELKDYILSNRLEEYYKKNYENMTYECEAEYLGIHRTLDYFNQLKLDFSNKDYYLEKAKRKKSRIVDFKRVFRGEETTLDQLFDKFIYYHPEIVQTFSLLEYEYKIKDDKVYHKSNEEMSQDYEMIMSNPNLTDAEKEKYQNFYSCFITPKARIS